MAKSLIKHKVHNGAATFLWQDNWHLLGPLCLHFDERIIYDVAIPSNSKVDVIISNNEWNWPIANPEDLMNIRGYMNQLPNSNEAPDYVVGFLPQMGNSTLHLNGITSTPEFCTMVPSGLVLWGNPKAKLCSLDHDY